MTCMNTSPLFRIATLALAVSLLAACSVDKFEARLQADPQCKQVMNAKTGALMPCPGSDKEFYKSIPALNVATSKTVQSEKLPSPTKPLPATSKTIAAPVECKPQLHQKSGSLMPCPAP